HDQISGLIGKVALISELSGSIFRELGSQIANKWLYPGILFIPVVWLPLYLLASSIGYSIRSKEATTLY
ncbi:MAG: hypothetical protein Q8J62_05450, partial [Candidatus Cloacimonadaceae bacterium]|nr:hypothetical protein [Candidatus Cloacimonadaceae bacterium]